MKSYKKTSYAFLVLTYNHEDWILEHLESIKYLVESYGGEIEVDLIVSDDCSSDLTPVIVLAWLRSNRYLFRSVKTIYNSKNLGTSACVENMLAYMVADRCKITAGDDVYSYENIFKLTEYEQDTAIVSGIPLMLIGCDLQVDKIANIFAVASQLIYQNTTLLHRFKHFSYNNAPNIAYSTKCLMDQRVRDYLKSHEVTEDWPIQIAIARQFPHYKFILSNKVLVYYRRTEGSTYIVANERFSKDKIQIYNDLIRQEVKITEKIRLISRKKCYKVKNRLFKKIFNIDFYCFCISSAINILNIINKCSIDMNLVQHTGHYKSIHSSANEQMEIIRKSNFKI